MIEGLISISTMKARLPEKPEEIEELRAAHWRRARARYMHDNFRVMSESVVPRIGKRQTEYRFTTNYTTAGVAEEVAGGAGLLESQEGRERVIDTQGSEHARHSITHNHPQRRRLPADRREVDPGDDPDPVDL